jgi:hypothetical protein
MSERREKRLGDAGSIPEAMRMVWLGKWYSPRLVTIIDCYLSQKALGPEQEPARSRYALKLAKAIELATTGELQAFAVIKKHFLDSIKDWKQSNSDGWPEVLDFALTTSAKIEVGERMDPINRDEIKKLLLKKGKGHFTPRHLDHMVKALRSLGMEIVAPKGRPSNLKRRTK